MKQLMRSAALAALVLAVPMAAQTQAKTRSQKVPVKSAARSWVVLHATTDQKLYAPGQPVQVHLKATNISKKGAYLRFSSGQRFDFSVYPQGSNDAVYTWSAARMFIQQSGSLWLKPGQSEQYEARVGEEMGQLKPGKYRLVARLTNTPRPIVAAPIEFEIANYKSGFIGRNLFLTARTDKARYRQGEPVQIDVIAANGNESEKTLNFDSGLDCDVTITDQSGNVVWNYGANLRFIRALGEVTWQKGETRNYTRIWDGVAFPSKDGNSQIKPGRYKVQAVLQSTPQLSAPPVFIEITR